MHVKSVKNYMKKLLHDFNKIVLLFSVGACVAAFIFYCMYTNTIIIRWSSAVVQPLQTTTTVKKKVLVYFYKHKHMRHEEKELLWPSDMQKAVTYLIASWLNVLFEEELVKKRVTLQSVILTSAGTQVYISFDRSPLLKESSVYTKLMVIQSLLKTLHDNGIVVQKVQFLVHHQPLHDTHLDFSRPWPASGYA